jgi:hypothetical protein
VLHDSFRNHQTKYWTHRESLYTYTHRYIHTYMYTHMVNYSISWTITVYL